jgi:CheY-like chemotaxis protein
MTSRMDTRRTVLLIEDNPGDVDLVKEYLDLADVGSYAVVSVPRIVDALAMLGSRRFDVIVLDLSLPDSSGIASVTEIRLLTRDIPIVVLTGADNEDLALACIEAGAQDYIAKSELQPVVLRRVSTSSSYGN